MADVRAIGDTQKDASFEWKWNGHRFFPRQKADATLSGCARPHEDDIQFVRAKMTRDDA